jgi:bacteriocin biosynthesis cyclodehydratase domain-containing protein
MVLALDPALPLLWRSPTTVQIGLDRPPVVLTGVSAADERMLWALRLGISPSGLSMVAASAGGTDEDVSALLNAVSDALLPRTPSPPRRVGRVVLEGDGPCPDALAPAITAAGHVLVPRRTSAPGAGEDGAGPETEGEADGEAEADLAVVVARYAVRPAVYGYWARRDVPLLAVVFSDRNVQVGPLAMPDVGPCLYCIDLHRTDADSAWPALAAQLAGRPAPTESMPLVMLEVSALVGRVADDWLAEGRNSLAGRTLLLDGRTGRLSRRAWEPHPECGCRALPGSATAPGPQTGADRPRSTTGEALAAPA